MGVEDVLAEVLKHVFKGSGPARIAVRQGMVQGVSGSWLVSDVSGLAQDPISRSRDPMVG